MKMFIEIYRGNKWCYIGDINYIIPENYNAPITCLAKGYTVDKNDLLNYIISGYCEDFAAGIGGVQLIEKREISTTGEDKCSKYILNTFEYDNPKYASYVMLAELLDIAKLEPFVLHGYVKKDLETYNKIESDIHDDSKQNVIFDITKYVIPNLDNIDENEKYNYEHMYFQSKCVTNLIEQIKCIIYSYFDIDILDKKTKNLISPNDIRISFWYDE